VNVVTGPIAAEPATYKLQVRRLRKTYGPVVALAGADVEMLEGEFLTLLGPSGSGKTTLLMMVAGLTHPDSGEVWIDGRLATYTPPFKRDVGMVFQNYALFPHLTVGENIAFPLRMRRMPEATILRRSGAFSRSCAFPMSKGACRVPCRGASSSGSRSPGAWSTSHRSF
jgi:ABC-type Fe3+/spermidine/putrescine transport system ATPase subunit